MSLNRLPLRDPRTLARDIPGLLDTIFPQLRGGLVSSLNRQATSFSMVRPLSEQTLKSSQLNGAMLFELAVVRAEQMLNGISSANWQECLNIASARQRRHFDARIPSALEQIDMDLAQTTASNLVTMLSQIADKHPEQDLQIAPRIRGYSWIASGNADFSVGHTLIEVKNQLANFSVADYRQVLMYWILSYASSLERSDREFTRFVLLNPRKNLAVEYKFSTLSFYASSGLGKLEIIQQFDSILADASLKRQGII